MTTNQIAYQRLKEEQRANLENERRQREESEAKIDQILANLQVELAQARKTNSEADVAEIEAAIQKIQHGDFSNQWLESVARGVDRGIKWWEGLTKGFGNLGKLIG